MNVEQALNAADESETEGLLGLYPMAAQVLAAEVRTLREQKKFSFSDALRIARGCTDYGGGHRGNKEHYEIYQHGIQTVIAALTAASNRGLEDTQVAALHVMGANLK